MTVDTRPTPIDEGVVASWGRIVRGAVGGLAILLVVAAVAFSDLEAAALLLLLAVVVGLRRRLPGVTDVGLGLMFLNMAFWTIPGTIHNVAGHASPLVVALQAAFGATAIVGLVALVAAHMRAQLALARILVPVAAIAVVVVTTMAALGGGEQVQPSPGDLEVVTRDTGYSTEQLDANAGQVAVHLRNEDFFWHTFSIPELGVHLWVPVRGAGRITFEAPPGEWAYLCEVPGHAGPMQGTLTVTP